MNTTIDNARNEALAYLRSRKLYILDKDSQFFYTPAERTDVRRTIENALIERMAEYDAALTEAGRPHA